MNIYVVMLSVGKYDDEYERSLVAFTEEDKAEEFEEKLNKAMYGQTFKEVKELCESYGILHLPEEDDCMDPQADDHGHGFNYWYKETGLVYINEIPLHMKRLFTRVNKDEEENKNE